MRLREVSDEYVKEALEFIGTGGSHASLKEYLETAPVPIIDGCEPLPPELEKMRQEAAARARKKFNIPDEEALSE